MAQASSADRGAQRVVDDRKKTLRRVLSDFPDPLLAALISGLELHGHKLRCGTLYRTHESSCPAGAMIRQLYPERFECGRLKFLVRHQWRRRAASYGGVLQSDMHVAWLEAIFDRAVILTMSMRRDVSERVASRVVGRWLFEEAERELGRREDRRSAGLPPPVSWREERLRRWGEDLAGRFEGLDERVLVGAS